MYDRSGYATGLLTEAGGSPAPQHLDPDGADMRDRRMPPTIQFSEQLKVLHLIKYIRELRDELDPIAQPPPVARATRITVRQQVALFELTRSIDELFPGVPILRPEPMPA